MNLLNLDQYPGGDLIKQGLLDLHADRITIFSCLIQIGFPTLSKMKLLSPTTKFLNQEEGELTLYKILKLETGDAYSRYNALIRQLISFERAIERRGC